MNNQITTSHQSSRQPHHWMILGGLLLLLTFLPPVAYADAPGTRGDPPSPQGSAPQPGTQDDSTQQWQGVHQLPPATAIAPATSYSNSSFALNSDNQSWLGRNLNPGIWVLDAGLGVTAGVIATIGATEERAARSLLGGDNGSWSFIPGGCGESDAANFVFCTPPELTYAHPNMLPIWNVMRAVAQALATVLFLLRIGRLLAEGSRSLATEGKQLLLTFMGASLFINTTGQTLGFVIDLFNAISTELLARARLDLPTPTITDLIIADWIMYAVFWAIMLVLIFKSFFRIVNIIVLAGIAPLAGALLMDRATAPRFFGWLNRLIDLLFEQVALTIVIIVATTILQPFHGDVTDSLINFLLGSVTLLMTVFGAPQLTGIARAATQSNNLRSTIQRTGMRIGNEYRKKISDGARQRIVRTADSAHGALIGQGADPSFRRAVRETVTTTQGASNGHSAAAPRTSFQMPAADTPTHHRYRALRSRTPASTPMEGEALANRRQRAMIQAHGMRAQADALHERVSFRTPKSERRAIMQQIHSLRQHADLQQRFALGKLTPRPSRWTDAQKERRREIARMALLETHGTHQIARDEARAALQQNRQALATAVPSERAPIMARIQQYQSQIDTLTPLKGQTIATATRAEAAALTRRQFAAEGLATPAPLQSNDRRGRIR